MIRVGIVGTGGMARQRAQAFDERQDTSVVGVFSRTLANTQQICAFTGARGYDDVDAMSHGGDDAQSLVTWNDGGTGNTETFDNDWGVAGSCEDFVLAMAGRLDHRQRLASDLATLRVGLAASESSKTRALVQWKDFSREE